jgi:hypothetical protein
MPHKNSKVTRFTKGRMLPSVTASRFHATAIRSKLVGENVGKTIIAITVKDILKEQLVYKLA